MLGLVDFFGASFIVFIMSIAEMVAVFWIYGTYIRRHSLDFFFFTLIGSTW